MLKFARLLRDPSWVFLLMANGIVLIQLAQGTLDSTDLIWTYWVQSVIMVFTWSWRLKRMGYDAPGSAVDLGIDIHVESGGVRRRSFDFSGVQGFLIVGLGFFAMYFLLIYFLLRAPNLEGLIQTTPGFLLAHLSSLMMFRRQRGHGEDVLMAFGQRMVPMHLLIFVMAVSQGAVVGMALVILKTALDVGAHIWEHRDALVS